jgi:tyrosyl-tRNA synthetase
MVPFFALRHLKDAGHRGVALLGGGTARIGDPSGKTETRKLISYEDIDANTERFVKQLDRFVGFDGVHAFIANNKEWLANLNYIEFLRDIGRHFSVNRMLSFEAYRIRMETGLSFIEFNYQLLQSYDFLQLFKRYNCRLQSVAMISGAILFRESSLYGVLKEQNAMVSPFLLSQLVMAKKWAKPKKEPFSSIRR